MCRSRRELSNEYLLAKFGLDTAENEPDYNFIFDLILIYAPRPEHLVRPALVVRRVLEGRGPVEAVEGARPADHRPGTRVPAPVLLRVDCADLCRRISEISFFLQFLAGSFSAVSKRNFTTKYAFDSIFQALQDLHTSAPLQSQNFRKKSV